MKNPGHWVRISLGTLVLLAPVFQLSCSSSPDVLESDRADSVVGLQGEKVLSFPLADTAVWDGVPDSPAGWGVLDTLPNDGETGPDVDHPGTWNDLPDSSGERSLPGDDPYPDTLLGG